MIYFIKDGEHIKIGFSKNPDKRFIDIQVSSPRKLKLLGIIKGGRGLEQMIHSKFNHLRVQGEWFKSAPEILNFMKGKQYPFHNAIVARSPEQLSRGLRYYRNALDKTQEEVAERSCVRQSTVSDAENHSEHMELKTIYSICYALGLELVLRPKVTKEFNPEEFSKKS